MAATVIDLRSDTVTRPSPAMREAMARAEVGDDVFGDDPTVNLLQEVVARILGKEAALYVPSGTMGNQVCIKTHTQAGDEVIAERGAHVFNYETAGAAFLSGVQVHTVEGERGIMRAEAVRRAIRPSAYYMPRTRLICLENTHNRAGGTICPMEVIEEIHALARSEGILMHLDGARLWNACAATGIVPSAYARWFDSASVCLSKGLGAPAGSVLLGSRELIEDARRWRKALGGGMRQVGILAAAGLYALDHHVQRLAEDHENAARFAAGLRSLGLEVEPPQTNIFYVNIPPRQVVALGAHLAARGIRASIQPHTRLVTHLDISRAEVETALRAFGDFPHWSS
jgi:threonine aldolase